MPKFHKIRWTEDDSRELEKAVRNFNAKISRVGKKNPEIKNALPEKQSVRALKRIITTRQDLKKTINMLKRFSRRGMETIEIVPGSDYNTKLTKWQRIEMNRMKAIVNRRRKARLEELEELEMSDRGQKLGYTRGQLRMGTSSEAALKPMNAFYRTMGYTDLQKRFESLFAQSQSDYYTKQDYKVKANYLKGLIQNYEWGDIKEIYEHIEDMDIKEFMLTFEEEGGTFEIISPPAMKKLHKQIDYESYVDALYSTWLPKKAKK